VDARFLGLSVWDWILLLAAVYVATISLVRLMQLKRDHLLDRLRHDLVQEQARRKREQSANKDQQAA
jgi:hypothetical protein